MKTINVQEFVTNLLCVDALYLKMRLLCTMWVSLWLVENKESTGRKKPRQNYKFNQKAISITTSLKKQIFVLFCVHGSPSH